MNKKELIDSVSELSQMTNKECNTFFNAFVTVCENELGKDGEIILTGFGTFRMKKRAAHEGINPATKQRIKIPAKKHVTFKPSKSMEGRLCKK